MDEYSKNLILYSQVKIVVYNSLGEIVEELIDGIQGAGYYEIIFNTKLKSSGIYFYVMNAKQKGGEGHFRQVRKMILLK